MNKNTIISVLAIGVFIFGVGVFVLSQSSEPSQAGGGDKGQTFPEWVKEASSNLIFGAIPGNSVESEVFKINGVETYHFEQAMVSAGTNGGIATGTVCVIKLPSASTTLTSYSAVITRNAPTSTAQFAVYNTIGGYATGTFKAIGGISDTIAQGGRLVSTSTQATSTSATGMFLRGSNGGDDNSFLVFDLYGGTRFTGTGMCRAELREL